LSLKDLNNNLTSFKLNLISFSKQKITAAYNYLQEKYVNQITITQISPRMVEIVKSPCSKGNALLEIAKHLKLNKSAIASIGDSCNDLSSFLISDLSIAINPKSQLLAKSATHILNYNKDAVADAIRQYIMLNDSNIKMIVSDLDGTLLDNKTKLVNEFAKQAIYRAVKNYHIIFTIATGRGIEDCLLVLKSINFNFSEPLYIVGNNGSLIYDVRENKYLKTTFLDQLTSQIIFDTILEFKKDPKNGEIGSFIYNRSTEAYVVENDYAYAKKLDPTIFAINAKFLNEQLLKNTPNFTKNN